MNRFVPLLISSSIALVSSTAMAQQTSEHLGRAFHVVSTSNGNLLTWRTLPTDDTENVSFQLSLISSDGNETTQQIESGSPSCFLDKDKHDAYRLSVLKDGIIQEDQTSLTTYPEASLRQVKLNRPEGGSTASGSFTYTPNDCSVGDVDGDGEYEIIVKWDPSNSKDNSQTGYTGNTLFDCYEIIGEEVGKQLWRIDMGKNIRAGAHYTTFLVYDFDGDGKAELVVKTAPGTKDASGAYVSEAGIDNSITGITTNEKDFRNSNGHVIDGEEFLTIFSGETGCALQTIWYNPNRGMETGKASAYGTWETIMGKKTNYNRGERYNACVAYLDGLDHLPSIVMQRGYYTQAYFWAVDWDGTNLTTRWLHRGHTASTWDVVDGSGNVTASGSGKSSYGQGVHGISVGDVDDDGFDEIVMGSATIDHNGRLLCSTGFGHGDAIHLGKFIPDRPGLQIFMPHEEAAADYGDDLHDAATGEILHRGYTSKDNGRGLACDMFYKFNSSTGLDNYYGWEFWSGAESTPINAVSMSAVGSKPDTNFRIYWNGDLYDDSFDGQFSSSSYTCNPRIISWNGSSTSTTRLSTYGGNPQSCNYTKATPCLIADIYGDWREEIVMWDASDEATLDIYSTVTTTQYPVPCLMTDHLYRMGIVWQNASYNQPPHLGYYLPDVFLCSYEVTEGALVDTIEVGQPYALVIRTKLVESCTISNDKLPEGMTWNFDAEAQTLTISGTTSTSGTTTRLFTLTGKYNTCKATVRIIAKEGAGISNIREDKHPRGERYDLAGRRAETPSNGIQIQNRHKFIEK